MFGVSLWDQKCCQYSHYDDLITETRMTLKIAWHRIKDQSNQA